MSSTRAAAIIGIYTTRPLHENRSSRVIFLPPLAAKNRRIIRPNRNLDDAMAIDGFL